MQKYGVDYAAAIGCVILITLTMAARRYRMKGLVTMLRKRAAAVICLGLAIAAAGLIFRGDFQDAYGEPFLNEFIRRGYFAFTGILLALIGVFHWLANAKTER